MDLENPHNPQYSGIHMEGYRTQNEQRLKNSIGVHAEIINSFYTIHKETWYPTTQNLLIFTLALHPWLQWVEETYNIDKKRPSILHIHLSLLIQFPTDKAKYKCMYELLV